MSEFNGDNDKSPKKKKKPTKPTKPTYQVDNLVDDLVDIIVDDITEEVETDTPLVIDDTPPVIEVVESTPIVDKQIRRRKNRISTINKNLGFSNKI